MDKKRLRKLAGVQLNEAAIVPSEIIELLQLHIDEAGINITPEELLVRVIRGAGEQGNLAEDYA